MGASVSSAVMARIHAFVAAAVVLALVLGLVPASAFADGEGLQDAAASQVEESSGVASALADQVNASTGYSSIDSQQASAPQGGEGAAPALLLVSSLASDGASIISTDVSLDSAEIVVGSFTVDGLTYTLGSDGLTLVAASPDAIGETSAAAPYEGSADSGDGNATVIPSLVTYDGTTYPVIAIGPYAFYLSGATSVTMPDSIVSVDDRAFRSSDVVRVEVDPANPNLASFDGCLYDSQLLSLLLIPEGRAGAVLLPETAEVMEPSKFSHCSLVDAISVEEGGAAFASWEGLLYSVDGTTLLRVPAGATDITVRDGCTTIAAGALEGCAKLERINAPASVTSISPDVFTSVPIVSLPAQSAMQDDSQVESVAGPLAGPGYEGDARSASADSAQAEGDAEVSPRRVVASSQGLEAPLALPDLGSTSASPSSEISGSIPQLTALVAVGVDEAVPAPDPHRVEVRVAPGPGAAAFAARGFKVVEEGIDSIDVDADGLVTEESVDDLPTASMQSASTYAGGAATVNAGGGTLHIDKYGGTYPNYADPKPYDYSKTSWDITWNQAGVVTPGSVRFWRSSNEFFYIYPERGGYEMIGWAVSNGTTITGDTAKNLVNGLTYTAQWRLKTYTVNFASLDGPFLINRMAGSYPNVTGSVEAVDNSLTRYSYSASFNYAGVLKPDVAEFWVSAQYKYLLGARRTGYTQTGWWDQTSGQQVVSGQGSFSLVPNGVGHTFQPIWTANTYQVSFSANGGSGGQSAQVTATYDSGMPAISTTKPTRAGYTFAGYYDTSAASGGTQYYTDTCASARAWNKTAAATLYARWAKNAVRTITLNKNGGAGGTSAAYQWTGKGWYSTSNPTDTTAAITSITAPTRAGYTYKGYATSSTATAGTYWTSVSTMPANTAFSANATLYAVWAKNAVRTITLNGNGGKDGTTAAYQWTGKGWYDTPSPDDTTAPFDAIEPPVRAGYTYKGYATSPTATSAAYWSDVAVPPATNAFSANATLYAVWESNEIALSWVSRPGVIMGTSCTYSDGATVGLPSRPTWQGYAFQGWWTEPDGGDPVTADTPLPTEDATYYAHWSPAISADVPLEVTAKVDLLGVEEQDEAQAYLESRSAAGLEVAEVEVVPLEGAAELFGAENLPSVYLEVIGGQAAAPSLRLALDQVWTEADPDALSAFALPDGYGTRVQVAYRFDIPTGLLPDLQEATKQVVDVSYTVKLAEEPAP